MSALALITEAAADGVLLVLSADGTVKARGDSAKVAEWAPRLRERKTEIAATLSGIRPATHEEAEELRQLIGLVYLRDGAEAVTQALCLALIDVDRALACYRELAARQGFGKEAPND